MTAVHSREAGATAARHAALVYFAKPSTLDEFMGLGSIVRNLLQQNRPAAGRQNQMTQTARKKE
jgi:hypothetical protein